MSRGRPDRRGVLAVALALLLGLSLVGSGVGTAVAGDQLAVISPEPHSVDAEPGEEFEVDVVMRSQGGHGGEGVSDVDVVSQYHPDYLEITAVEAGPWLEGGEETDVHAEETLVHEEGTAILEQWREPAAGGSTGNDVIATLTVEVAEDASASEATISFDESVVELERGFLMPIHNQDVTVSIDGGGDEHESFDHDDPAETLDDASDGDDESDDSDADDASHSGEDGAGGNGADESNGDNESDGTSSDDATDPVPGFAVGAALGALAMALLGVALAARSRRGA